MIIRTYKISDTEEIVNVFKNTVQSINSRDYTQNQIEAWISNPMSLDSWRQRFSNAFTYIAELEGMIVGFGMLEESGYIDCFYCHKDFQGKGVGTKLLQQIEGQAKCLGIERLFAEVSITARKFFECRGFHVIKQQEVIRNEQKLINFLMEKLLM